MAKGKATAHAATLDDVVEKLEAISKYMLIQLLNKDFAGLRKQDQVKILVKHGLKNKEVADLLDVLPSYVSNCLKK